MAGKSQGKPLDKSPSIPALAEPNLSAPVTRRALLFGAVSECASAARFAAD